MVDERSPRRQLITTLGVAILAFALAWMLRWSAGRGDGYFFVGLLWGLYLLTAMVGWGTVLHRALLAKLEVDWGLRAAMGMAVLVVLGGVLNLCWLISTTTVFALLAVGVAAALVNGDLRPAAVRRWIVERLSVIRIDPLLALLVAAAAAMILLHFAAGLAGTIDTVYAQPAFDLHDDCQAYLVFPEKMLELGSMGAEPFEPRRMLSLGGQSFLVALARSALPVRAAHLVDMGVAMVILAGLVVGCGRRHRFDPRATLFVVVVLLGFPSLMMRGNTSAVLTGVVLMLGWYRLLADVDLASNPPLRSAMLVAVQASAMVALKSTFIPAAVVIFVLSYGAALISGGDRRRIVTEAAAAAGLVVLMTAPWMISIWLSSGTLLYPVFGRGFYGGVYTDDFASLGNDFGVSRVEELSSLVRQLVGLLPLMVLAVLVRDKAPRRPIMAMIVAIVTSVVMLVLVGDPEISRSMDRYAFPLLMAGVLALLLAGLREGVGRPLATAAAVVVGSIFILGNPDGVQRTYEQLVVNTGAAWNGAPAESEHERRQIADLQAAMPPGETFLASLRRPYLLDLERNPVRIMSLPGMSSLPPGMPIDGGAGAVASYLERQSIHYLAYGGQGDTEQLLQLTVEDIHKRYPRSKMRWVMLRYHQRYCRVVWALSHSRKRLYANGYMVALDLRRRVRTVGLKQVNGPVADGWLNGPGVITGIKPPPGGVVVLRTRGWHPLGDDPEQVLPRVLLDGDDLAVESIAAGTIVFRLPPEIEAGAVIEIVPREFDPALVGACSDGGPRGLDLHSVELATSVEVAGEAAGRTLQPISDVLEPPQAWRRTGFFTDKNWTNGDAAIEGLSWPVREGRCSLVVSLMPAHPKAATADDLALRVKINGIYLEAEGSDGLDRLFHLYDGLESIERIRIVSSTFVPAEVGSGSDSRRLGVPVRAISIR